MKIKNLKVCMLSPTAFPLASARHLLSEARHLAERGADISFIVPHHYYLPFEENEHKENELVGDVRVKHIFPPKKWRDSIRIHFSPIGYWTYNIVKRALEEPFDIIHVMKPYYTSAAAGLLLHLITRKPMVLECDDLEGKKGWSSALAEEPLFGFKRHLLAMYERHLPLLADAVIATSRALLEMFRSYGVKEERLFYLPYPVEEYMTQPGDGEKTRQKLGLGDEPVVIYCGALHPHHYDCDLLIDAMNIVRGKLPTAKLLIVGDGGARPGLERRAEEAGLLNSTIIFTGWVPRYGIPDYIAAADAGVVPMRDTPASRSRGLSKVLEYLCQARPVVMPGIGQAAELTDGGKAGFLIEPGNPSALADGIITALTNPVVCEKIGLHGQDYVREKFDWSQATETVLNIYRKIMLKNVI
ncbi:MAG: glycosyltransferase family 4 protein [Candidatus Tritonobacter lacicola]|nr:glycosyltransferase family 4 protein [Candidatus Tritonobacter lacicola]